MNALPLMASAAADMRRRLMQEPGCRCIADAVITPSAHGLDWTNTLLHAPAFRRAHVETLDVPGRVSVLHVCVFPHLDDPTPIYGFDMVAGVARVSGIFLDLSPVDGRTPKPCLSDLVGRRALKDFAAHRIVPEWGDIFSDEFLAIRPADDQEVERAIELAKSTLNGLLQAIGRQNARGSDIAAGQTRYIDGQRRNQHTFRMLAGFIGAVPARQFIDEVLFPALETA